MGNTMTESDIQLTEEIDIELLNPGRYKNIVHNDDVTPVDFVIAMLMQVFNHPEEIAKELTLQVHNEGSGIAGVFSYEVAEQKGIEATLMARQHGFPLSITIEEE